MKLLIKVWIPFARGLETINLTPTYYLMEGFQFKSSGRYDLNNNSMASSSLGIGFFLDHGVCCKPRLFKRS